jgi:hypothetical protein
MFRYSFVVLASLLTSGFAQAAPWAEGMFEGLTRDFGSVPRGPMLTHPFRLTNNTGAAVTISNVRVSCGCTSAHALQNELAPGESTAIVANMDSRRFWGVKRVTIYVQFSQPSFEEVRLWVQANSRDEITVTPDSLAFGQVKKGGSPVVTVAVSLMGVTSWKITGVTSESNYVQATLKTLAGASGEVNYQVAAKLRSDTPVGKWYTDLWLETNNASTPRIRVPLTVEVQSVLSLSPAAVIMGEVKKGQPAERKIIVRGAKPFKITGVQGIDGQWAVRDSTRNSKAVHILTITLNPKKEGEMNQTIKILTDLKEEGTIELPARAQVVP